jgi:xylan 1,4-beta-xylosidase
MNRRASIILIRIMLLVGFNLADAGHIADNGDGTYSNPLMPNAHWSDPSVLRHDEDGVATYFIVTSSVETTPNLQILRSTDLVNWVVVSSVMRYWPSAEPNSGAALAPKMCWSPRLSFVAGRFRVMWHGDSHFLAAEAPAASGPWALIRHNLTSMGPTPQNPHGRINWAPTVFTDPPSGKTFIFASNWIQECDAAALNWVGNRTIVVSESDNGVGLLENPSLMQHANGYYYWHVSSNGTVTWGLSPDPVGGENKGMLSVWRSKNILGPYEGPRHVIMSTVEHTCVNTGTVALGPDNTSWYYLYDALEASLAVGRRIIKRRSQSQRAQRYIRL